MKIPFEIIVEVAGLIEAVEKAGFRVEKMYKVIGEIHQKQEQCTKVHKAQYLKTQLKALKKRMDQIEQQIAQLEGKMIDQDMSPRTIKDYQIQTLKNLRFNFLSCFLVLLFFDAITGPSSL